MTRLQRYIAGQWLSSFGLVVAIVCLAIFMVDLLEQSRTVGTRVYVPFIKLVQLALLKLPMLLGEVLGFAFLIATLLAYAGLGRRKELPVIQTSGLSSLGIILPAAALTLMISLIHLSVINPIGASGAKEFEVQRAALISEPAAQKSPSTQWVDRSGETKLLITATLQADGAPDFSQFSAMEFTSEDGFVRRVSAAEAIWAGGLWMLSDVRVESKDAEPSLFDQITLVSTQDPAEIIGSAHTRKTVSLWSLPGYIELRQTAGLSIDRYLMRLYELLARPIFHVVMTLLGVLACLRLDRLGRTALRTTVACFAGLGLFLVVQFAISLGATGLVPPAIAAFAPPAAGLMIALFLVTASDH